MLTDTYTELSLVEENKELKAIIEILKAKIRELEAEIKSYASCSVD